MVVRADVVTVEVEREVGVIGEISASGLVGTELYRIVDRGKISVSVVGRFPEKLKIAFPEAIAHMSWQAFKGSDASDYDVIVNLAGSSVSSHRWTPDYKKIMVDSRLESTRMCVEKCAANLNIHLINASAVSAYGFYTDPYIRFTEQNQHKREGQAFLQDLIDQWEAEAMKAKAFGNAITLLRTGVVFDPSEGALQEMMRPFKMFMGGKIGTGRQMMSWISKDDIARIIAFLLERPDINGPVNCVAPNACDNAEFSSALSHAMSKPSLITTPAFLIRMIMGQMGDELIVKGQHVYPEKLLNADFKYKHETIQDYFEETFV